MTGPDLRQMRYFVKVAEHGGFTAAATELHVAPQAVSQQVKALEQTLGVTLLHRGSRAVTLTEAGEYFLPEARQLVEDADELVARTRAAATGAAGPVRIGYVQTTSFETVPILLAAIGEAFPDLDVEAVEVLGGDLPDLFAVDGFDLVVITRSELAEGFAAQPIRRERFLAAIAAGHPLAGAETIDLADLSDEAFEVWSREMAPGCHDAVVAACRSAGFEPRRDPLTFGAVAWAKIAGGAGVALVVESQRADVPQGIRLVELRSPADAVVDIDVVWDPGRARPEIGSILDLAAELTEHASWLPAFGPLDGG